MLLVVNALVYLLSIIPFVKIHKGNFNPFLVISKEKEVAKFTSILAVCTFFVSLRGRYMRKETLILLDSHLFPLSVVIAGFKTAQLASAGLSSRIEIIINKKVNYLISLLL